MPQRPNEKSSKVRAQATSQRRYRARQKERLKNLERLAALAVTKPDSEDSLTAAEERLRQKLSKQQRSVTAIDLYAIFSCLSTREEQNNIRRILTMEHFTIRDVIKYGLITLGYYVDPLLLEQAGSVPAGMGIDMIRRSIADVDIIATIFAGMTFLAGLEQPSHSDEVEDIMPLNRWLESAQQPVLPIPATLTLRQVSYLSALGYNAIQIGIPPTALLDDYTWSPFTNMRADSEKATGSETSRLPSSEPDANNAGAPNPYDHLKRDLKPTAAQLAIAHHPCYDLFPWPAFRTNAILAVSMDPPLIDEDDLCLDVMNGAMRCWGSTSASLHGRGQGEPWDTRSWEVAPWFLEKWEALTDGPDGDMWTTSNWWRAVRGA